MIEIDFNIKPKETIPNYVKGNFGIKCLYDENGQLHSYNDLPAFIFEDGTKIWYKHGKCHRDNDLPALVRSDGMNFWYIEGKQIK